MKKKKELRHLNAIADALIQAGYEVEEPSPHNDLLDVWGYEQTNGKRRRRCFEEIYCTVIETNGLFVSYWTTNKTYDGQLDNIEIIENHNGTLSGINQLIDSLSVERLKRKKYA